VLFFKLVLFVSKFPITVANVNGTNSARRPVESPILLLLGPSLFIRYHTQDLILGTGKRHREEKRDALAMELLPLLLLLLLTLLRWPSVNAAFFYYCLATGQDGNTTSGNDGPGL